MYQCTNAQIVRIVTLLDCYIVTFMLLHFYKVSKYTKAL